MKPKPQTTNSIIIAVGHADCAKKCLLDTIIIVLLTIMINGTTIAILYAVALSIATVLGVLYAEGIMLGYRDDDEGE